MSEGLVKIAVGRGAWHEEFAVALDRRIREGAAIAYDIVDIDAHDWAARLVPYDLVIWRGRFMGAESSGHYKEKVYFIERVMGKVVVPNYATLWHFDSKVAQSYLFAHAGIPTPSTFASFDYDDSRLCLESAVFPIVAKRSHGASSANVRLIVDRRHAGKWLKVIFFQDMWDRHKAANPYRFVRAASAPWHGWFWAKALARVQRSDRLGVAYWQEYVPGNNADLRITVVGDKDAFGFWRRNRPGDFRASGSGLLDYETAIPERALKYCISLNRKFGFDSMAYDILCRNDELLIVEMSYGYFDKAVFAAPGHFVLGDGDCLVYHAGNVMPQELWVDWALLKARMVSRTAREAAAGDVGK